MSNRGWFEKEAYARDVDQILATDWGTVAKLNDINAVNRFIQRLAAGWVKNGVEDIDILAWNKVMKAIQSKFPDAVILSFEQTEAYHILNNR